MRTQQRRRRRGSALGGRLLPANWRVRPRLIALILLPTAAAVALAGLNLARSLAGATEYHRTAQVASLVERLGTLSHEMAEERDLTAWYIAEGRRPARLARLAQQRKTVDRAGTEVIAAIDGLDDGQPARLLAEAGRVGDWLNGLSGLRKPLTQGGVLPRASLGMYSRMIADFTTLHDDLGRGGDERLTGDALALGALTRAREQAARQRGILLVARIEGRLDFDDPADFLGAYRSQLSEQAAFQAVASPADVKRLRDTLAGQGAQRADAVRALAMSRMREGLGLPQVGATTWYAAASAVLDGMRGAERDLAGSVVARSRELESSERRSAMIAAVAILVLLVLILLFTAWVARSLVRPLRRLRREALQVAGDRLPETVRLLRESGDLAPEVEVPSIGVTSRDEIGEVARAFDEVHREALRLASDEARLRNSVNAMFVNLSRRTQALVERQIDLIDDLEQGEEDETRLASFFKLDHLATRMRRNSENLLVLAGQEQSRRWSEPVPLGDVVRASLSEVENYERVVLRIEPGTSIVGSAVNDIVHLVAELVENAVFFSPHDTKVVVSGAAGEAGAAVLAVTDSGIGMSDEELDEANRRLADPPAVDLSVSRRMGLFVVGRLALRHGVRVRLRRSESGGLSALVLLPAQVVAEAVILPETAMAAVGAPVPSGYDPFGAAPAPAPGSPIRPLGGPDAPAKRASALADLWSSPVMSASVVEDLWASPLTPAPPPPLSDPSSSRPEGAPSWTEGRSSSWTEGRSSFSPAGRESEEFLPIFEAVGSDWFRRSAWASAEAGIASAQDRPGSSREEGERSWAASADGGWTAAEAAAEPADAGVTAAGLPKRVPRANLVPGTAPAEPAGPAPAVSAERVRSRLSGFQQGVRRGRAEMSERPEAVEGESR